MKTIHELRKQGYKVRVEHWRMHGRGENGFLIPQRDFASVHFMAPKGGMTVVEVTCPDGSSGKGVAECSLQDAYNKEVGRNIALARAFRIMKKYEFFKQE